MTEIERYATVQKAMGNYPDESEAGSLSTGLAVWHAAVDCFQAIDTDY